MCEGTTDYTNHLLECILDRLESDEYENGDIFTLGGAVANSPYILRSPYNTECEYAVIGAALVSGATAGYVVISNNNSGLNNLGTGNSFGSLAQGGSDMNTSLAGVALVVTSTTNALVAFDHWMPLGRGANVYVFVSGAPVYVYIATRRKLERYIPQMPRMYPSTHSQPQSRRALRQLPAQSAQVAGFESQYPTLQGKKSSYQHDYDVEGQDTRNIGNAIKRLTRHGP